MSAIIETLATLVDGAARYAIENDQGKIGLATANLVVAMESDGLIEAEDTRSYQAIMEILVESGVLNLSRDDSEVPLVS
mgnify:CR=1 FL=1